MTGLGPAWPTAAVVALSLAGILVRPFAWPEPVWAVAGAAALVGLRLISPGDALGAVAQGTDVYLFLGGMMLLSELARLEGLFAWLAAAAVRRARGSARRLFGLVFAVATIVTVLLSNDATAVVLTPAVAAATRAAHVERPLPYLLTCAFVANAASFVLPISNPANLVIYASHIPPLLEWLPRYGLASALAVAATYAGLRWTQRGLLRQPIASEAAAASLPPGAVLAACGLALAALALVAASAAGWELGLPTALAALATWLLTLTRSRRPFGALRGVAWGTLPLVAGLFVLVGGLERVGAGQALADVLGRAVRHSEAEAGWLAGASVALAANLVNNLPAGLLAARVLGLADSPDRVRQAVLIGVDLGPNLSVTGSLATILWLAALRREGLHVGAWEFLKLGAIVMPPALVLALALAASG